MQPWSMLAARGGLSVVLGLAVLVSPTVGLGEVVTLFGLYALLDGISAAAWIVRVSRRPLEGWPVLLEAVCSIALGVVALWYPFQSARFLHLVALWGLVTGILEILAATRFVHGVVARSFLAAGGAWSIFLALLVLVLPYALTHELVLVISVYALVFGILVTVAALGLRGRALPMAVASVSHSSTTR